MERNLFSRGNAVNSKRVINDYMFRAKHSEKLNYIMRLIRTYQAEISESMDL